MRVVVANKFWYPRGGLERVMFEEISLLGKRGVEFAHFSCSHPDNMGSPWEKYFVDYLELGRDGHLGIVGQTVAATRMFHNRQAAVRFGALLDAFRPDLVHAHGIHRQLSPAILEVARRRRIPVVESLHDFHHVCPADLLLAGDGAPCVPARCSRLRYGPAVSLRCVRGSRSASALSAAETWWQRARGVYERSVTRFIAPSRYLCDVMRADGWEIPIDLIPNPVDLSPSSCLRPPRDPFVLVASRLSPEKGVEDALRAARGAGVEAVVAGDGALRSVLEASFPEARFVGRISSSQVRGLMCEALATVVPSRCIENAPLTVLESMAVGTPVIAARVGGIPELISDGIDGVLVPPNDVHGLACAITQLLDGSLGSEAMVAAAHERVRMHNAPSVHADLLMASYRAAVGSP